MTYEVTIVLLLTPNANDCILGRVTALDDLPDGCTAEEAVGLLAAAAVDLGIPGEPPTVRTLRLWRSKRLLTSGSRRVSRRNLLEALAITRLTGEGVTTSAAAERCRSLGESDLIRLLSVHGRPDLLQSPAEAQITLQRLAQGLLAEFRLVAERGAVVGYTDARHPGHAAGPAPGDRPPRAPVLRRGPRGDDGQRASAPGAGHAAAPRVGARGAVAPAGRRRPRAHRPGLPGPQRGLRADRRGGGGREPGRPPGTAPAHRAPAPARAAGRRRRPGVHRHPRVHRPPPARVAWRAAGVAGPSRSGPTS